MNCEYIGKDLEKTNLDCLKVVEKTEKKPHVLIVMYHRD
jgi:hypothetical protein